jgi:hypothetical protein
VDGLAPQTQAELLWRALERDWTEVELLRQLTAHTTRRAPTCASNDTPPAGG